MKKLQVHPLVQPPDECAVACVAMVLAYHGYSVPLERLQSFVPNDSPKWRDWLIWLGYGVQRLGGSSKVVTMSTQVFDMSWRQLSMQKLANKLRNEQRQLKAVAKTGNEPQPGYLQEHLVRVELPEVTAALAYLNAGGTLLIEPLTVDLLQGCIDRGLPVIVSVDATILYRSARTARKKVDSGTGTTWGHVVIVCGYDNNHFFVVDPTDWFAASQQFVVPKPYVVEAVTRRDQNVLIINKAPAGRVGRPTGGKRRI